MATLALVLLLSTLFTADATFDCRRPEQTCVSGRCNYTSPLCTNCNAGFSGYNCGLETAQAGQGGCSTDPCETGSTCYDDAGVAKCYCAAENYGDTCKERRLSITCKTGKMIIGINPLTATVFSTNGIAYVEKQRTDASCRAVNVPAVDPDDDIPDTWLGQVLELADTACGGVTPVKDATTNKITFSRNLVILYNEKLVTERDDLFTAKCVFGENGVVVESSITKVDQDDLSTLTKTETEASFSPVTLTLTSAGTTVDPAVPLKIGAELLFTFTVPAEYASLKIVTGEANNTKPVGDPDEEKIDIIAGSCTTDAALPFTMAAPALVGTNKREISLTLKAFHFYGFDQVIFRFTVKVCLASNDADCDAEPTCPGKVGGEGRGRKKREARGEEVLERIVTVIDPSRTKQVGQTEKPEGECRTSGEMMAALISMGIVIFTLLVLVTILIGKALTSRNNRADSKQDLFSAQSVQSLPRI